MFFKKFRALNFSNVLISSLLVVLMSMVAQICVATETIGNIIDEQQYKLINVPIADNLRTLAEKSRIQQLPIVLMYAAEDCEYCDRLEEDVIRPMIVSGAMSQQAVFSKVMIDAVVDIRDFTGGAKEADDFAYEQNVMVTPTIQFVDANGKELAPKVVGYQSGSFYDAYLDKALQVSKQLMLHLPNSNSKIPHKQAEKL